MLLPTELLELLSGGAVGKGGGGGGGGGGIRGTKWPSAFPCVLTAESTFEFTKSSSFSKFQF